MQHIIFFAYVHAVNLSDTDNELKDIAVDSKACVLRFLIIVIYDRVSRLCAVFS